MEYAKNGPEDLLIRITPVNRRPEAAALHLLPTLWFRNTWSWRGGGSRPELGMVSPVAGTNVIGAHHTDPFFQKYLADYHLFCEGGPVILFTENETNIERLFGRQNASPYVKDGIHNFIVNGEHSATNPANTGTKASAWYPLTIEPGETQTVQLRLTRVAPSSESRPFEACNDVLDHRIREADEFYDSLTCPWRISKLA